MVQRYDFNPCYESFNEPAIAEDQEGRFVKHDDYAALEAERDEAEAHWERLRAAVAQGVRYYDPTEGAFHVTVSAEAMGAMVCREPETGED